MTTRALVLVVLGIYMLVMIAIGVHGRRNPKENLKDAMIVRGQSSTFVLVGCILGVQMGSGFIVGGSEYGALYGLSGAWYGLGSCIAFVLFSMTVCKTIYNRGYVSLSDYFSQRYEGVAVRLTYSVASLLGYLALLASQLLAGRAIFLAVGLPANQGVMATALISLIYTMTTGMLGIMGIAAIQSSVVFGGIVVSLALMVGTQGLEILPAQLPENFFRLGALEPELWVTLTVPTILGTMGSQSVMQRIATARDVKTAQRSYFISGLITVPIAMIPPLLGMYGKVLFPDDPPAAVFMRLMLEKLPTVVAAVVLAAIISAVMTSCNTAFISAATITVHDLYEGILGRESDPRTSRRLMTAVNVLACVAGVVIALKMNDILKVLALSHALTSSGCLIPFLGGMLWKGATTKGALSAAFAGMTAIILDTLGIVDIPFACITAVLLSLVVFVVVSLLTREAKEKKP